MRYLVKPAFWLLLLVATATNAWSADGRILNVEGDVRVNGQPVTTDTVLHREDVIVTAAGAYVTIVLSDNSVLDLDSESQIKLSDYSYSATEPEQNKSEVNVVEGTLRYVSGLIAKEDPDDIGFTAGNSTIGVRGSFTEIEVNGVIVNVEAMIGEATLTEEVDGEKATIVVPTGKATKKDPTTGEVILEPSSSANKVNEVVHAIAAAAPDASFAKSTDKGCSESNRPVRGSARPAYDEETAAFIEAQLATLTKGELMMVMAVLINNASHLCIDSSTIASTVAVIATVRPDEVNEIVDVVTELDPEDTDLINETVEDVEQDQDQDQDQDNNEPSPESPVPPPQDPPPGGAPSPE